MTSPTSIPSFGDPTPPARIDLVRETLQSMDLEPTLDQDGDLKVAVQDQQIYLRASDDGPGLLRVFGQWQIVPGLADDPNLRFGAAHHVTATHALVKLHIMDDTLVVAVDNLVPEGSRYAVIVPAAIEALLSAVGMWHSLIAEQQKAQQGGTSEQAQPEAAAPDADAP